MIAAVPWLSAEAVKRIMRNIMPTQGGWGGEESIGRAIQREGQRIGGTRVDLDAWRAGRQSKAGAPSQRPWR